MRPTTLLIATRNRHKTGEIAAILGDGFHCLTLDAVPDAPTPVEDATTFEGNALKKALGLAAWLAGRPDEPVWEKIGDGPAFVLADDSGLEVDALDGAPGVRSARFAADDTGAAGNSTDTDNNAKLLRLLSAIAPERRTARFRCALALVPLEKNSFVSEAILRARTACFEGACEGHIRSSAGGQGGFGYDPLFVPVGHTESFAELGETVKNRLSHRARALEALRAHFA